ncbi:CmcI family methyltransferase [Singulisphaera sp. PoT]|uniref:CmcI family methyltransferase n=1 Tax=Singulisphaera sp. PoT TaxID=3411797 RepID=UPI003BF59CDC
MADDEATIRDFHRMFYHGLDGNHLFMTTTFLGVTVQKCPLDLWVYQEIVHRTRPDVIVECGVNQGGSTLYLASLCDLAGRGEVVACDVTLGLVPPRVAEHPRVTLIEGNSIDPAVVGRIARRCQGLRTMVILDSDHREAHVAAELRAYAPLVTPGCYMICEDTNINGHPVLPDFGPGPLEAVADFLAGNPDWEADPHCERLLLSFNGGGYLLRKG